MTLIVGGTGEIGRALIAYGRNAGCTFRATARNANEAHVLDLASPPETWKIPDGVDAAIICASVSGIDACERDPTGTFSVNVTATITLADRLSAKGAKVSFLSSSQVFDPKDLAPSEGRSPHPLTEYGRQKLAVERYLMGHFPDSQVIRLTKVVSSQSPRFREWTASLAREEQISASSNLFFSPIGVEEAAGMIWMIASSSHTGIFHLSASDSISYLDAAMWIASARRAKSGLVGDCLALNPNTPESCRLSCDRTAELVGYRPKPSLTHLQASFTSLS